LCFRVWYLLPFFLYLCSFILIDFSQSARICASSNDTRCVSSIGDEPCSPALDFFYVIDFAFVVVVRQRRHTKVIV
jgi:hypothetical protein